MDQLLILDQTWLTYVAVFSSLVTALLTRTTWSSGLKAIVNLALVAIGNAVAVAVDAGVNGVAAEPWIVSTIITFAISVATYKGLWKPTTIAPKVSAATDPAFSTTV